MTLLQAITVGKNPKKSALFAGNAKLNIFEKKISNVVARI